MKPVSEDHVALAADTVLRLMAEANPELDIYGRNEFQSSEDGEAYDCLVESTMRAISKRLYGVQADHNKKRNLQRSRLCQLPPEVLAHIFSTYLDGPFYRAKERSSILSELCLVCYLWNEVIQSQPSLWSHIDNRLPLSLVRIHLKKSGKHPLVVEFDENGDCESSSVSDGTERDVSYSEEDSAEKLLELCRHINRWRKATFNLTTTNLYSYLCKEAPFLEEFCLELKDFKRNPPSAIQWLCAPPQGDRNREGSPQLELAHIYQWSTRRRLNQCNSSRACTRGSLNQHYLLQQWIDECMVDPAWCQQRSAPCPTILPSALGDDHLHSTAATCLEDT